MSETGTCDREADDRAWVVIETPLAPDSLRALCRDAERMLRINSMIEFTEWRELSPGRFCMRIRNLAGGTDLATELAVTETPDGCRIDYAQGLKRATVFRVEPGAAGARLTVIDDYGGVPAEERARRLNEVDRSLLPWGHDLRRYFVRWRRWTAFAPWRWYMERVWQPMRPAARRIVFWLVAISVAEFAAFLLVVAVFWLETE